MNIVFSSLCDGKLASLSPIYVAIVVILILSFITGLIITIREKSSSEKENSVSSKSNEHIVKIEDVVDDEEQPIVHINLDENEEKQNILSSKEEEVVVTTKDNEEQSVDDVSLENVVPTSDDMDISVNITEDKELKNTVEDVQLDDFDYEKELKLGNDLDFSTEESRENFDKMLKSLSDELNSISEHIESVDDELEESVMEKNEVEVLNESAIEQDFDDYLNVVDTPFDNSLKENSTEDDENVKITYME